MSPKVWAIPSRISGPVVEGQFGGGGAGLDERDPDVAAGDLLAERLGEGADTELGGVVDPAALSRAIRPATELTLTTSATRRGSVSAASSRWGNAAWVQ